MNAQISRLKALDPPTDEAVAAKVTEVLAGSAAQYRPFLQTLSGMLPFAHAKEFMGSLVPEGTDFRTWTPPQRTYDYLLRKMQRYLKKKLVRAANTRKPLSVSACVQHFAAWSWLIGDVDTSSKLLAWHDAALDYCGKPIAYMVGDFLNELVEGMKQEALATVNPEDEVARARVNADFEAQKIDVASLDDGEWYETFESESPVDAREAFAAWKQKVGIE